MTYISTLAVAAPVVRTEINPNSQPVSVPMTAENYLGGAAIAGLLAVMIFSGLSAAGMIKLRGSAKSAPKNAPWTAH